jgi:ATP-dependent RNA helicase DHX36
MSKIASTNFQEARALLAKVEYQRGHVEEALRMLNGINIPAMIPDVKISITRLARAQPDSGYPPMSLHSVNLIMETIYLKTIALRDLGKFKGTTISSLYFVGYFLWMPVMKIFSLFL